jgi:hypothetical protein
MADAMHNFIRFLTRPANFTIDAFITLLLELQRYSHIDLLPRRFNIYYASI